MSPREDTITPVESITVRRTLTPRDPDGIAELLGRVYSSEYGLHGPFRDSVRVEIEEALARGWPDEVGAVWLVDAGGRLSGALALTDEGGGVGHVRWFVLAPELRRRGLGRWLFGQLLAEAPSLGFHTLELETFSALEAAARIYRDAGFRRVGARCRTDWGRPILDERYELRLRPAAVAS